MGVIALAMPTLTVPQSLRLAAQYQREGRARDAEALYKLVLSHSPNDLSALLGLVGVYFTTGQTVLTVEVLQRAVTLQPTIVEPHNLLGQALQASGRLDEAIASYERAIALRADYAHAITNLGTALHQKGRPDEAVACFRRAMALEPRQPTPHFNLACVLQKQGQLDEGIAEFRQTIALAPKLVEAHANLGDALRERGDTDEAIAACTKALAIQPTSALALTILGTTFVGLGRHDEAVAAFDRALAAQPGYAEAQWCRGTLHLLRGEFIQGWKDCECRARVAEFKVPVFVTSRQRWDGGALDGRRILLTTEQGLGDTIHFVRYATLVAARGGRVVLDCPAPLKRLMQTVPGVEHVVARGVDPLPDFDFICPLLSLPWIFQTTLETVPADVPYVYADPERVERWEERFDPQDKRLRVGLVWGGNPAHRNERNRSLPLRMLAPLGDVDGAAFYSLQKGPAAAQAADTSAGLSLIDWTGDLDDFTDTAALVENLDLVIAVDTSVAHLAGAMARPTWVLLPAHPDFRWMLDRSDSPWYPTMQLFRQPRPRDWATVIDRVAAALRQAVADHTKARKSV